MAKRNLTARQVRYLWAVGAFRRKGGTKRGVVYDRAAAQRARPVIGGSKAAGLRSGAGSGRRVPSKAERDATRADRLKAANRARNEYFKTDKGREFVREMGKQRGGTVTEKAQAAGKIVNARRREERAARLAADRAASRNERLSKAHRQFEAFASTPKGREAIARATAGRVGSSLHASPIGDVRTFGGREAREKRKRDAKRREGRDAAMVKLDNFLRSKSDDYVAALAARPSRFGSGPGTGAAAGKTGYQIVQMAARSRSPLGKAEAKRERARVREEKRKEKEKAKRLKLLGF